MYSATKISVIVPAFNNAIFIGHCLSALCQCNPVPEIIVVDDASTDGTAEIAEQYPCTVIRLERNRGAGYARNHGVSFSRGDILFFLDSDILLEPETVGRIIEKFAMNPEVDALFGSYQKDTVPKNFFSQYKNLLHHFTHQNSSASATTFCGGFGAVRRQVFEHLSGFDESLRALEDIEFGYRMYKAGYKIRLEKDLQFTHLKSYTLSTLVHSDVLNRSIPWTKLMLKYGIVRNDLNTKWNNIGSVVLAYFLVFLVLINASPVILVACTGMFLALNKSFLLFVARERGFWFMLKTIAMSWLFYFYSGLGLLVGLTSVAMAKSKD